MKILGISRYWGTRHMDCLMMYLHKKKCNQIRSRSIGIHCWPACLSLYLSGKLLLRNSATLDNFVWRRKWYFCISQSVASSILPSHHAASACNYCSWTFLIYLFLRFAGVSYGQFIAVRIGFNLSTYIENHWW